MLSRDEFERYDRIIKIDKIGVQGQEKLKSSSVVVVGAGGLGSPILLYLTAMGVGRIGIVEGDAVSISNLGRQVLYSSEDVGKDKVILASERLKTLNPYVTIDSYKTWLTDEDIAKRIFEKYEAVIDATDNFETRYIVNKAAVALNKPVFVGAVGRFVGQVLNIFPHKTACLNCLFPEKDKEIVNLMTQRNFEQGVSTPLVGTVGTIVVNEYVKYAIGIGENLFNKLLIYDSLSNEFSIIKLERNKDCKVCGDNT